MDPQDVEPVPTLQGMVGLLKSTASQFLEILHTRAALLCTDLEEERRSLQKFIILMVVSFASLGLGLLLVTLLIVFFFWEEHPLLVLGIFAALYITAGITAAVFARRVLKQKSRMLDASLEELSKDIAELKT
jgi:uncharacterized membrane protein YqjE